MFGVWVSQSVVAWLIYLCIRPAKELVRVRRRLSWLPPSVFASRLCDVGFRNQDLEAIVMAEHNFKSTTTTEGRKKIWTAF